MRVKNQPRLPIYIDTGAARDEPRTQETRAPLSARATEPFAARVL
jgi:hypothetical protein